MSVQHFLLELEQVPKTARRPGPEVKLVVNKTSTRYYPGLNAGLDKARGLHLFSEFLLARCKLDAKIRARQARKIIFHNPARARARFQLPEKIRLVPALLLKAYI